MKEFIPFTLRELDDLVRITNELIMSELNDEEKNILNLVEAEKKETKKTLGRRLTDGEQIEIEKSIPGGWDLVPKLEEIAAQAVTEVKNKRIQ